VDERFDVVVRAGSVVRGDTVDEADVGIRAGRIAAIAAPGSLDTARSEERVDARGLYVLPGVIDAHVHFREPGLESKEAWSTGSLAAVMGGVTTVIDMPNTVPVTATAADVADKAARIEARSWCDAGVFGLAGEASIDAVPELAGAGVLGFKAFMGTTVGDLAPLSDDALRAAMVAVAATGLRLGVHAEDDAVIAAETARLRAEGRTDPVAHAEARPPRSRSTPSNVRAAWRTRPVRGSTCSTCRRPTVSRCSSLGAHAAADITCELTPHHAFLAAEEMPRLGSVARVNPPLRPHPNGEFLVRALADGRITAVATDHAPHEPELKLLPDIWRAVSGFAGVETALRLFLTFGVHRGAIALPVLARAMAAGPARTWGLAPRKGAIEPGADADLVLVDLDRVGVIRASDGHSRNPLGPWEGVPTRGMPVMTFLRGELAMRDGEPVGEPRGRFVRPHR
jgi:dihydroorotase (multifunctional complex type)